MPSILSIMFRAFVMPINQNKVMKIFNASATSMGRILPAKRMVTNCTRTPKEIRIIEAINCPTNFGIADNPLRSSQSPKAKITLAPAKTTHTSWLTDARKRNAIPPSTATIKIPPARGVIRACCLCGAEPGTSKRLRRSARKEAGRPNTMLSKKLMPKEKNGLPIPGDSLSEFGLS